MSAGTTTVSDIIVPSLFTAYTQQYTQQKSRIIASGAVTTDAELNGFLAGGGLTINSPSFKDLDDDEDNVSSDTGPASTPNKIGTANEISVRLSRNNSWSTADLASALAGKDPAEAIQNRVGDYWVRRTQSMLIAVVKGVFANNATATDAYHVKDDMMFDASGSAFSSGVTNFSAEAFIDATATLGDSMEELGMIMVHSIVYARMMKNNLIDFVVDSANGAAIKVPTFLGRIVIVDDAMPRTGGVFDSWLFGAGAVRMGIGSPKVPTEVKRDPSANNGGGQETLFNRMELCFHPVGYAYVGTPPNGGPSNAATTNNLAAAGSWRRAFTERKQIKVARLVTREF